MTRAPFAAPVLALTLAAACNAPHTAPVVCGAVRTHAANRTPIPAPTATPTPATAGITPSSFGPPSAHATQVRGCPTPTAEHVGRILRPDPTGDPS